MDSLSLISEFTGFISNEEVCKALSGAQAVMADSALLLMQNKLYAMDKGTCTPNCEESLHCLYLYTYALSGFPTNGQSDYSMLTEEKLSAILTLVEQTSKSCCCE